MGVTRGRFVGHAIARALLAHARARGTEAPWAEIWDRDVNGVRLAYVTEPAPVSDNLEGLERPGRGSRTDLAET